MEAGLLFEMEGNEQSVADQSDRMLPNHHHQHLAPVAFGKLLAVSLSLSRRLSIDE